MFLERKLRSIWILCFFLLFVNLNSSDSIDSNEKIRETSQVNIFRWEAIQTETTGVQVTEGNVFGKETSMALTGDTFDTGFELKGRSVKRRPDDEDRSGIFPTFLWDARRGEARRHSSPDFPWRPYFIRNYQWSTSSWFIASSIRCSVDRANTVTFGIRQEDTAVDISMKIERACYPQAGRCSDSLTQESEKNLRANPVTKELVVRNSSRQLRPNRFVLLPLVNFVQLQLAREGISARKRTKNSGQDRSRKQ